MWKVDFKGVVFIQWQGNNELKKMEIKQIITKQKYAYDHRVFLWSLFMSHMVQTPCVACWFLNFSSPARNRWSHGCLFFLCGVYTWLGIHWFFHSSSSGWVWLQSFWIFKIKWFMFIWGCWLILMTLFLVFNLAS